MEKEYILKYRCENYSYIFIKYKQFDIFCEQKINKKSLQTFIEHYNYFISSVQMNEKDPLYEMEEI